MPSANRAIADQAAIEPTATASDQPTVNHRPISRRIKAACDALVSGKCKTITHAAELANLSREHLSRELSKPHVTTYLQQKAYRALAIGAGRAAAVKLELLESDSDHVRDSASTFTLALAGIKPKSDTQVSVNIELKAGYVIDLSEGSRAAGIAQPPTISTTYAETDSLDT